MRFSRRGNGRGARSASVSSSPLTCTVGSGVPEVPERRDRVRGDGRDPRRGPHGKRIVPVVEDPKGSSPRSSTGESSAPITTRNSTSCGADPRRGQYPVTVSATQYQELRTDTTLCPGVFRGVPVTGQDWMSGRPSGWSPWAFRCTSPAATTTTSRSSRFSRRRRTSSTPRVALSRSPRRRHDLDRIRQPDAVEVPARRHRRQLASRIEAMAVQLADQSHAVFNLHVPPYGSGLDLCPRLDTSTDPPARSSGRRAPPARVRSARRWRGFIHAVTPWPHPRESGIRDLGGTTAVNPGSEYGEGVLHSAIIDLSDAACSRANC